MDDMAAGLACVRAQLQGALLELDRLAELGPPDLSAEEREAIAAAVLVVLRYRGKSLEALLRWFRDVKDGQSSWIVAHSLPGEHRADAWYVKSIPAHLARKLTH